MSAKEAPRSGEATPLDHGTPAPNPAAGPPDVLYTPPPPGPGAHDAGRTDGSDRDEIPPRERLPAPRPRRGLPARRPGRRQHAGVDLALGHLGGLPLRPLHRRLGLLRPQ